MKKTWVWNSFAGLTATAENVAVENGKLRCGAGTVALHMIDFIPIRVAYFEKENVCFALSNDFILKRKGEHDSSFQDVGGFPYGNFGFAFACLDGENAALVVSGEQGAYLVFPSGAVERLSGKRALPYAVTFHDRLFFAVAGGKIAYGDAGQLNGWTSSADGAGEIELAQEGGETVGLAVLKERLYVFRQRGIACMDARGAGRDFTVEYLPYGGGRIVGDSVCPCGRYVLFLATDGVYRFDGNRAERICEFPANDVDEFVAVGAGADGGYYYLSYGSAGGKRKTLAVNAEEKTAYTLFAVDGLTSFADRCYGVAGGELIILQRFGALPFGARRFSLTESAFGSLKEKTAVGVRLNGKGVAAVRLCSERGAQEREISMEKGVGEGKFSLKGKRFSVEFLLQDNAQIDGAEICFQGVSI